MKKYIISLLVICFQLSVPALTVAGQHYTKPQYAVLQALDKKSKTITVRNTVYKLRQAVKIHDSSKKLPTLSSLTVGNEIKFSTHKNNRTGQIEISEIWVLHM